MKEVAFSHGQNRGAIHAPVLLVTSGIKLASLSKQFVDEDELGEWGSEIPGNSDSGKAATAHHNYLVLLPSAGNVVAALSLSRSGEKVAKNLNAAIKMGNPQYPLPVRKFNFTTVDDVGGNGDKYKNWAFKPAGYLGNEEAALANLALKYAEEFRSGGYTVDQSDTAKPNANANVDDEIPF
jgi:hypothetical protein